jgi:hypothetical protein
MKHKTSHNTINIGDTDHERVMCIDCHLDRECDLREEHVYSQVQRDNIEEAKDMEAMYG